MSKLDWFICAVLIAIVLVVLCLTAKANIACREQGGVLVKGLGWYECVDREALK